MEKQSRKLSFRSDGTFTIVQFTDVHWIDGSEPDLRSLALMEMVLQEEKPDLVFFTGDVIYTGGGKEGRAVCPDPFEAFRKAVSPAERIQLPWAAVFGNHDTEVGVSREQLADYMEQFDHCVSSKGLERLSGFGNFALDVHGTNGKPAATLFGLDSGDYSRLAHVKGYDWIKRDQIDWYVRETKARAVSNGGEAVPTLVFFHIPLPEYRTVWETAVCYGHKLEDICAPQLNSGFFAAMVETGSVMGTFCGHDHINDFWGELYGIRLCYGRATGYHTYGREGFPHGARIIRLREGERRFETWLRLDDGTVATEQPVHHPDKA